MSKELAPHQQRVVEEARELDEKIDKLDAFLRTEKAAAIDGTEKTLLGSQLMAMKVYSNFLHARIRLWGA